MLLQFATHVVLKQVSLCIPQQCLNGQAIPKEMSYDCYFRIQRRIL